MKIKPYEILPSLPPYGPIYIPVSHDGHPYYSEGFPVRFFKSDGTNWVANFKPGIADYSDVFELRDSSNLLVIAYGEGYLINPEETKPISVFGGSFSAAFHLKGDRLLLQDDIDLTIVEPDGKYWHSDRISWDGLKVSRVEDNLVTGIAFDPMSDNEWIDFTYDLESKLLTGGSCGIEVRKKNWWKIPGNRIALVMITSLIMSLLLPSHFHKGCTTENEKYLIFFATFSCTYFYTSFTSSNWGIMKIVWSLCLAFFSVLIGFFLAGIVFKLVQDGNEFVRFPFFINLAFYGIANFIIIESLNLIDRYLEKH